MSRPFLFLLASTFVALSSRAFHVKLPLLAPRRIQLRQTTRIHQQINADFDYSSTRAWNEFWSSRQEVKNNNNNNNTLEWHSFIPFSLQVSLIPRGSTVLVVGCGNSAFPRILHNAHYGSTHVTCLDSSTSCINSLIQLHGNCKNMTFVCGDAVAMSETLHQDETLPTHYNIIFDKGLMDAIFCDEGWDWPLTQLLTEASRVLAPHNGRYVLISYRLAPCRMEFLEQVGNDVGLSWKFNVEGTNERVSISIATKI